MRAARDTRPAYFPVEARDCRYSRPRPQARAGASRARARAKKTICAVRYAYNKSRCVPALRVPLVPFIL